MMSHMPVRRPLKIWQGVRRRTRRKRTRCTNLYDDLAAPEPTNSCGRRYLYTGIAKTVRRQKLVVAVETEHLSRELLDWRSKKAN